MTSKNLLRSLLAIGFLSVAGSARAQSPTVQIIGESTTSPLPGTTMYVTVTVCDAFTYNSNPDTRPKVMAAIISGSGATALSSSCSTAGQFLVVDNNIPGNIASSAGTYDQTSGATGVGGPPVYPNINVVANAACAANAVTTVWPIYIDGNFLPSGNYSFVAEATEDYMTCGTAPFSSDHFNFTVPFPPPAITLTKIADGSTANANDLVLFRIDYNYVNQTGPVTITDTIPANVTLVAPIGGAISPGGSLAGSTITWVINPVSQQPASGEVWFLTRVNSGVTSGTVITNTASSASASTASVNSNVAQVDIGSGGFTLLKSESATSLAAGSNVTYALSYQISGMSLQVFDSYDNVGNGTTNGSITGYDGTGYDYGNTGGMGGFTIQTDAQGNHYIRGCAYSTCDSSTTVGNFPTMLRTGPSVSICNDFMVEGDMEISPGASAGGDATMIIADNTAPGGVDDAYMLGISVDNGPGNFFLQKNNQTGGGTVSFPKTVTDAAIGSTITAGVWYTAKVLVTYSAGSMTFQAKVWPRGSTEPSAWSLTYTDASPLPCTPASGGKYQFGWQADGTSSTDYYSNLKLYTPDPVANARIWDTVPVGVTYSGDNNTNSGFAGIVGPPGGPLGSGTVLNWSFPGTIYNLTGAVTWWGPVTCGGAVNQAAIMGDGPASQVVSNAVTLTVTGCFTNTPTNTPTNTATPTPTNSPTNTPTKTPTFTPTHTPTLTATPTPTNSPTHTPTPTPTNSPTNTPTQTPTRTPTNTPTPTATPSPTNSPTDTPTITPTKTPTNTSTDTPTITPTDTPTDVITPTFTNTPTNTATPTPTYTSTNTPTVTPTWTPTNSPTATDTPTPTATPTNTPTITSTSTPTATPTDTTLNTPTNTATSTNTFTPTNTRTDTPTPTNTNTPTNTATATNSFTATQTPTNSPTATNTSTPTDTPTPFVDVEVTKTVSNSSPQSTDTLNYSIALVIPGNPASGITVWDTLPANMTYLSALPIPIPPGPGSFTTIGLPTPGPTPGTGLLLVWTLPGPVPNGTYTLGYSAQVNDFVPAGTVLLNQAALNYPGLALPKISQAPATVTGQYTVNINVYNEAGELVKSFPIEHLSQPIENVTLQASDTLQSIHDTINIVYKGHVIGTWDGTNNAGDEVTNGKYYIKIDNIDNLGSVTTITQIAMVARHLASTTVLIYNEAGEIIRHLDQFTDDAVTLSTGVSISANSFAPSYQGGVNSTTTITLNSGTTMVWDGRNDAGQIVASGQYFIVVHSNDGQGSDSTVTQEVTLFHHGTNLAPGGVNIYPDPNHFSTDGWVLNFDASSSPNLTLRVRLYTIAGELVDSSQGAAGTSVLQWDLSAKGLASGLYLAEIDLVDPMGASQRAVKKILLLH